MDGQLLLQISRSATKNLFWFTSIYRFSPVICSYFFLSHKFNDRVTQYLKMIIFLITNRSHRDSACMPLVSTCLVWFERASRAHVQQNMEARQQNREHRARGLDLKSGLPIAHPRIKEELKQFWRKIHFIQLYEFQCLHMMQWWKGAVWIFCQEQMLAAWFR